MFIHSGFTAIIATSLRHSLSPPPPTFHQSLFCSISSTLQKCSTFPPSAVIAAAAATVSAQGSAYVYNHCAGDVYLWAVDIERNPQAPTVIPAGGTWSEVYHTLSEGGVSVKIAKNPTDSVITQFEYTLTSGEWDMIWYDGSNINCVDDPTNCPFHGDNLYLGATVDSCPQRYCASQDAQCAGFYNTPDQNTATLSCKPSADTFLHLCLPDEQMPGGSAPPAPPAPASTTAPTSAKEVAAGPAKIIMEAPASTTMVRRTIAQRAPAHEHALAAHAHARRHMHAISA